MPVLFSGQHYAVHFVRGNRSRKALVYFDFWRDSPSLTRANPLESFFHDRALNGFTILAAKNDWFQDPEIFQALAAIRAKAPNWRLFGFGGSMGGYGVINHYHDLELAGAMAIIPQFSLDPAKVPYETRWRDEASRIVVHHDRLDRLPAIQHGWIVYDKLHVDALHVRDIQRFHAFKEIHLPFGGHDEAGMLSQCGMLSDLMADLATGTFDAARFRKSWREHRRKSAVYWLGLATHLLRKGWFSAVLRALTHVRALPAPPIEAADALEAGARAGLAAADRGNAAPPETSPLQAAIGHIDGVQPSGLISGWCAAPTAPFTSRRVTILVDGVPALGGVECTLPRPDLHAIGIVEGLHGFAVQLQRGQMRPGQSAELRLRDDASNAELGTPVQVVWSVAPSRGSAFEAHIDDISPAGLVSGWCYDRAEPTRTVEIEVHVDGVPCGSVCADMFRLDLQIAGKGTGQHGFVFALPVASLATKPVHTVGLSELGSGIRIGASMTWQRPLATRLEERIDALERQVAALAAAPPAHHPAPALLAPVTRADNARRIVWISGEMNTPGHIYRVVRMAEAARGLGYEAIVFPVAEALSRVDEMRGARFIIIWRAPLTYELRALIDVNRRAGTAILFDVDDLMVEPELARVDVIDAIRSEGYDTHQVRQHYQAIRETALIADATLVTTQELGYFIQALQKPVYVVPNGFDAATLRRSRLAWRRRTGAEPDGLVRIGYAGGSRTHQHDFGLVAPALACILAEHGHCRLVLFHHAGFNRPLIDLAEYPDLIARAHQVEWRDMVPLEELPDEIARFDINLAPLEVGNPFCEAKSELKFFEAAIAGVPTIASPTGPFRRAIRDGETGILAANGAGWETALRRLVKDPGLRRRMAQNAFFDALHRFGPERRQELLFSALEQMSPGKAAARAFELELHRGRSCPVPLPHVPEHHVVQIVDRGGEADISVVIPVYNYQNFVPEALDSVWHQDVALLDLVVVDDCSTDHSLRVVRDWIDRCGARFNRVVLLQNMVNSGLGLTRNVGFAAAETRFVLPLDADNRLLPRCASVCLQAIGDTGAAFAYPKIHQFGQVDAVAGAEPFHAARLAGGNFIDAMALVDKSAWAAAGGYDHVRFGWEDYDFWCRLASCGFWGTPVTEILAQYRVHTASMLRTTTDIPENKKRLIEDFTRRHPWVKVPHVMAAIQFGEPAATSPTNRTRRGRKNTHRNKQQA